MDAEDSTIPSFWADGYLPGGVYCATEAEVTFRFGVLNRRRRRLILRVRRWIELARPVEAILHRHGFRLVRLPEEGREHDDHQATSASSQGEP